MANTAQIPKDVIFSLFSKDRGYVNLNKSKDRSTGWFDSMIVDKTYVKRSMEEFNRTSGKVANGREVEISTEVDPYFKITNNIKIKELAYNNRMYLMSDTLEKEIPGFFMYVDGKKVPDNKIVYYPSESYTDIFLPLSDWQNLTEPRDVYFESVYFKNHEYIHFYKSNYNSNTITIECNYEEDRHLDEDKFDANKGMVFLNGLLIDPSRYTIAFKDNVMTVSFKEFIKGEIEFYYNHALSYKKYKELEDTATTTRFVIDVDKNAYKDILRGGVPKVSAQIFIDGYKIPNGDIEQLGRQHYRVIKSESFDVNNYQLIIEDYDLIDDDKYTIYGSDYYLQKMIGNDRINSAFNDSGTDTIFDEFDDFNIYDVMCESGDRYHIGKNLDFFNHMRRNELDSNVLLSQVLDKNPSLMKDFMKFFAKTSIQKYIKTNEKLPEKFTVGTLTKINTSTEEASYEIFIDGQYINPSQYTVETVNSNNLVHLKGDLLKPNAYNLLELTETITKKSQSSFFTVNVINKSIERTANSNDKYKMSYNLKQEMYGTKFSGNVNDITVLKRVDDSGEYMCPYGLNVGYVVVEHSKIVTKDSDGKEVIVFLFPDEFDNDIVIYFKNFFYRKSFVYTIDKKQALENMSFLTFGTNETPLPVLPSGTAKLYVNNEYFLEGVDYTYTTPENNAKMAGSAITYIRNIKEGDSISFTVENVSNKIFLSKYDIDYNSQYGLLYFSQLPFPFSLDYLDLYIDSTKITNDMIQILSDKLIRIPGLSVPFTDIYLASKFNYNWDLIEPYTRFYKKDKFESIIEELFKSVDYTISDNDRSNSIYSPDEIYEAFEDDVGLLPNQDKEGNKDKNPEKPKDESVSRVSQYVERYVKWLISTDARTVVDTSQDVSKQVLDYFSLYNIGFGEVSRNITIDTGSNILTTKKDLVINSGIPYADKQQRLAELIVALKEKSKELKQPIASTDAFKAYLRDKLSNKYLVEGFPLFEKTPNFENQLPDNVVIPTMDSDVIDFEDLDSLNIKHFEIE